jgi:WD40 repeat protein/serine/threonine protein kinase
LAVAAFAVRPAVAPATRPIPEGIAMTGANSDRNLLFGVLALQMDFVGRDALVTAMHAWVLEKAKPLGQLLVEQGALRPDNRDLLETLVARHLEMHGQDLEKSLAALHLPPQVADDLGSLTDDDVQASLARLPTPCADGSPALPVTTAEVKAAGDTRYHLLRPHGKGGLGEVFVALDEELHREVALKEIRPEHAADPRSHGRFVREAEITGGLEHPGIVPVYGLGAHADGRPFYAMRFIQGETLRAAIGRYHHQHRGKEPDGSRELELRGLLTRFVTVCNAVAYAHSRGVIHRDLKPANVMLGKFGETLVVDWGLAKAGVRPGAALASSSGNGEALPEPTLTPLLGEGIETQAGSALGTPAYMSPEQATGRLDLLGQASDIYSLGATLYTVLTGRPPIEGKDGAEILSKAQRGQWLSPRQVKADVPAALDAVCRKAMAQRPAERYSSALQLAGEIERWLADEPVAAYAEPWSVRSRRWLRRRRTLVSTAVGALVVALVGTTVGLVLVNDARDQEAAARKTADEQRDAAERQREQARFNQYVAQMNLVEQEYEANNIGRVRELLEAQIPPEPTVPDFRGFEWYYWQGLANRERLVLKVPADEILGLALNPDGTRLATADSQAVRIWNTATGQQVFAVNGRASQARAVAYSPHGRTLALASGDGDVRLVEAVTGREIRTFQGHAALVLGVAFSGDGGRLASVDSEGIVRVYDTATAQDILSFKVPMDPPTEIAFSPDGRRLAVRGGLATGGFNVAKIWDTATGRLVQTLRATGAIDVLAFSPDGQRLAFSPADDTARIWDVASGREPSVLRGHTERVQGLAFSPDCRLVASAGGDSTVRTWFPPNGWSLALKGHTNVVTRVVYSVDGRWLASAGRDGTVRLWDAATWLRPLALTHTAQGDDYPPQGEDFPPAQRCFPVVFSADGRRLVHGVGRTVRAWDAATGQRLQRTRHGPGAVGALLSPDGRLLALGSIDGTVQLCDADTNRVVRTLQVHHGRVQGLAFSPDGRRLASWAKDQTLRVCDVATGKELLRLTASVASGQGVAFSSDGRRVAAGNADSTVRVWDAVDGRELLSLAGHTRAVEGVAFSPDGRRLASGAMDGTVRVWDALSGEVLRTLKGHRATVWSVAFSPDGRRLASASGPLSSGSNSSVRLWDVATGQELLNLREHRSFLRGVAFSPDGRRLVSWGPFKIQVWEPVAVEPETWRQRVIADDVDSLFDEGRLKYEVLAALRNGATCSETDRACALRMAESWAAEPAPLNDAAWIVVAAPRSSKDAYAQALRRAEAAVRLAPDDGIFLNTLGVGQYRAGRYAEALDTLAKSEKLTTDKRGRFGPLPRDLAFLAMARHQVGKQDEAKATLSRLRKLMSQPSWAADAQARGFLREAQELIEGKAGWPPK